MNIPSILVNESVRREQACNKCRAPCYLGDFKQIADLKNSGLLIYVHKDIESAERAKQKKKEYFFILHNTSHRVLKQPEYTKEICQYSTKCVQCKEYIHRVRSLLDEITDMKQNEVVGVCNYCNRPNYSGNCKRCKFFVNKFKCSQTTDRQQERSDRFIAWIHKVNALIQSILECENVCSSKSNSKVAPILNELHKLLEEVKTPFDVQKPDISMLTTKKKSTTEVRIIEMLEELLHRMKYDTGISTSTKENPRIEHGRLTFMNLLAKNKKKLEELLFKMKYETDIKLLSKMLNCACEADSRMEFRQPISMDFFAKNKQILGGLLLKMKYDRMREHSSDDNININTSSNDTLPEIVTKIAQLKPAKKENLFKKFIEVMSQKGMMNDDNSIPDKTCFCIARHKNKEQAEKKLFDIQESVKLKPELSKVSHGRRHSFGHRPAFGTNALDEVFGDIKSQKKQGTKIILKKGYKSVDAKDYSRKAKGYDKKHDLIVGIKDSTTKKQRVRRLYRVHDSIVTKDDKRKKKTKLNPDGLRSKTLAVGNLNLPPIHDPCSFASTDVKSKTGEKGGFLYQLSDRKFIKKGWTIMPKTKTLRKIRIYKMKPASSQYDWFEKNKNKKNTFYDTGEKLAEIYNDGHGRWYYKNGEVALNFYNTEEDSTCHAGQRYVVYNRGDDVDKGKMWPRTVLASFDHRGNGVVYDRYGNERLKYNQFEGVLHDASVGPETRWTWHSLNEPPELQEINVENYVKHIDPGFEKIFKKINHEKNPRQPRNQPEPEILEIEREKYAKYEAIKRAQKFKPFKIRMKVIRMSDNFSLRILGQSKIDITFRVGSIKLKANVGMNLINEVVDTEIIETTDVATPYGHLPPLSQSLENIQKKVDKAKKVAKMRAEKTERLLMPPNLSRSAFRVGIGLKDLGRCSVQSPVQYPAFQVERRRQD